MIATFPSRHALALVSATLLLGACAAPGYYDQYGGPIPNGVVLSRLPPGAAAPAADVQPVPAPQVVSTPQATAEALRQPQRYAPFPPEGNAPAYAPGTAAQPAQPYGYPPAATPSAQPYYAPPGTAPTPGTAVPARPYSGPLTPTEKQRYDQIDQQVLREQDRAMRDEEIARTVVVAPAPVYPVAYPGWYGPAWGGPVWAAPAWGPSWGGWYGGGGWGRRGGWSVGYGFGW
ncbi:hypothetical protein [Chitinasiproducens palmae]|uniref:Lipoprotein n=1 Tax=Chitinasiproducens palmae TaxID=1770053 RepID=A0A1H2PRX2_9BURK|nr:hypothetical protein [Chitinasiproducens palmae]SDV49294.1 hypothetical protein SAMN05216551_107219 [Chitinasiproducens palmae]